VKNEGSSIKKIILAALPLILGAVSVFSFALYFYSANHASYKYIDIILIGPPLSVVGIIISIITRKLRNQYPTLWIMGLFSCIVGFIICVAIVLILIAFAFSFK
jgi:hypothetical protein